MDVAHATGVSIASASRALGRPELVSEDMFHRVLTSARELGYFPSARRAADSAALRRFGAVITDFDDVVLVAGLAAMATAIEREDGSLLVAHAGAHPDGMARSVHDLVARGTRAIAFFGVASPTAPNSGPAGALARFASFDSSRHDAAPASGFLYAEAIALAALYLGQSGHRRIALIGVRDVAAIRELCREQGGAAPALVDTGLFQSADLTPAVFQAWRADEARVTAVICGSDRAAEALLQVCEREGIAVPGQLSIVGYGDSDLCRATHPSLSSLRVPAAQAGEALARTFIATAAGGITSASKLSAKLILRESTRQQAP